MRQIYGSLLYTLSNCFYQRKFLKTNHRIIEWFRLERILKTI